MDRAEEAYESYKCKLGLLSEEARDISNRGKIALYFPPSDKITPAPSLNFCLPGKEDWLSVIIQQGWGSFFPTHIRGVELVSSDWLFNPIEKGIGNDIELFDRFAREGKVLEASFGQREIDFFSEMYRRLNSNKKYLDFLDEEDFNPEDRNLRDYFVKVFHPTILGLKRLKEGLLRDLSQAYSNKELRGLEILLDQERGVLRIANDTFRENKEFIEEDLADYRIGDCRRDITCLTEAIETQRRLKYASGICNQNSVGRLVDLALFPQENTGVYVVFRTCQLTRKSPFFETWDEVTVGAVRRGTDYKTTIKDSTATGLERIKIIKIQMEDSGINVDLEVSRGIQYPPREVKYSLRL